MHPRAFLLLLLGSASLWAEEPAASAPKLPVTETPTSPPDNDWVFSLLPKSMQKNPRLELTVITEMTSAGRALPPVSPDKPAYFEVFTNGPKAMGGAGADERSMLKQQEVERVLLRALATNGYRPAKRPENPPSLLIIYTWGAHDRPMEEEGAEAVMRALLDRAALVGGEKFATKLIDLFDQQAALSIAANAPVAPGGESVIGPAMEMLDPINQFRKADPKNDFIVDQAASDLYYVVASAYDYRSVTEKRRLLLWRTRMTVGSAGVSQDQAVPTLVFSAGPFFGKEMTEPAILNKRTMREGSVELGTPTVVETPAEKK